jgi:hypothetical protein
MKKQMNRSGHVKIGFLFPCQSSSEMLLGRLIMALMELLAVEHSSEEPDDGELSGSGDDYEG